jgi:hypothetical protein
MSSKPRKQKDRHARMGGDGEQLSQTLRRPYNQKYRWRGQPGQI